MTDLTTFIGSVSFGNFILFIAFFLATVFFSNLLAELIRRVLKPRMKGSKYKIIANVVQYLLVFSATYYGLSSILDFNFNAFMTAFGVIGIGVAFSAQQTIQNLIGGIFILGGGIIKLDEWIEAPGFPTTTISQVKEIGIMRTTLREYGGRLIELPNSVFVNSKIVKYPDGDFFKVDFELKISSKSDIATTKKMIIDMCNKNEKILPNIPKKEKKGLKKLLISLPEEHNGLFGFLERKIDYERFEPEVTLKEITDDTVTLQIWIWLWEIRNKEKIISNLMEGFLSEFPKSNIKLA